MLLPWNYKRHVWQPNYLSKEWSDHKAAGPGNQRILHALHPIQVDLEHDGETSSQMGLQIREAEEE